MKTTDSINALTLGLLDGGGEIFTNFPGYISHKLYSALGGKITSVNEKIAYEIAWGASFSGKRSAVMFKNVGLNDAADPFLNSMLVGVNAGLVLIIFDDMFVEGSQSRQDSRHYFDFFEGLWFEPYSIQNAYDVTYSAFSLSEKFNIPIVIRITNQLLNLTGDCKRNKKQKKISPLVHDHKRFVIHPTNYVYQSQILNEKKTKIKKYIDNLYKKQQAVHSHQSDNQIITFGCCESEIKQYKGKKHTTSRIFTYPIPKFIDKIVNNSKNIIVIEQGNSFAFNKIHTLLHSDTQITSNTGFVPDKSSGYIISKDYEKLFSAIKEFNISIVVGDLGEYTKDSLDSIDTVLCFGSSIGVGIGCQLAGQKDTFSITGDTAYLHSGKNSIVEAIARGIPIKIIVICNNGSQVTGGQIIPGDLTYCPKGVEIFKLSYKNSIKSDITKILKKMLSLNSSSILLVQI